VQISVVAASLKPNGTTATATAHWRSEQRIERSGMGFTFLRPSFFQQNLLVMAAPTVARTGLLLSPLGRAPIAMVDVRDIAACAVVALLEREPANAACQLTGPRGVSLDDIAAHLGVLHVPIPTRMAARGLARDGATPDEIDHALRMAAFFAAGSDSAPTDHVQRLTGRAPRRVEVLLDEHRNDFAPATGLARTLSRTTTRRSAA
jgi:NAD(P)H dehydrogenase (quinone)